MARTEGNVLHEEKFLPPLQADRKCKNKPVDFFFPIQSIESVKNKKFCEDCKVRQACLNYAMHHNVKGIWGGTNDIDRGRRRE